MIDNSYLEYFEEHKKEFNEIMANYNCALMQIETKFKALNEQFNTDQYRNPIEYIKTRLKTPESIYNKVVKYGVDFTLDSIVENILDIAGVRVVTSFVDDIYALEASLLAQDDIKLIKRKDYISNPKESGYRSLHLVVEIPVFSRNEKRYVKVEVQFRTIAMDFWASLEHKIRYKQDLSEESLTKIADDLSLCALFSHELDMRMQEIRKEIEQASNQ